MSGYEGFAGDIPVTPHDLLPEQKIEVIGEDLPQWKTVWDEARKNALQGNFEDALRFYRALLLLKSNLEEARWEMARLLMHLKRWDEAAELLELLIGSEPESTLYLSSLGKVMWEMEQYERAVDLFKKIYLSNPTDQIALAGLVEGLTKLDRKNEAIPYLEQLSRQEPTNRGVRSYLANLFFDQENFEKARPHLTILARNEEAEPEVLYKTAKTYGHLGLEQEATVYWERLLARESENLEAHTFLAGYYEKAGQLDRALSHLKALVDYKQGDAASFAHLGETYEKTGDHEKALFYYEKYLDQFPEDRSVKRRLESIITASSSKKKHQASLDHYFDTDSETKSASLRKVIMQYKAEGRYQEAIPLYRQLLELSPNDPEILATLADVLLAVGEDKGKSAMTRYLSNIAPENLAVYRSMAELLRKLKRNEELIEILHKIHEIAPEDSAAIQELAILYLGKNNLSMSQDYFTKLSENDCKNIQCLQARALLSEKINLPEHELRDHEALLEKYPDRYLVRLRVIDLAARMGLLDTAVYHAGYLRNMPSIGETPELKISLADAYRESGYFMSARKRYRNIVEKLSLKKDVEAEHFRIRSWLGIAESYKESGLFYEAEQTLRMALAAAEYRSPILEALFELSLARGDVVLAEIWLQAIIHELNSLRPDVIPQNDYVWKIHILRAEMFNVVGDYGQAVEESRKAQTYLDKYGNGDTSFKDFFKYKTPEFIVRINMAANLMYAGQYTEAEKITLDLRDNYGMEAEPYVLLGQIYQNWGKYSQADKIALETDFFTKEDFGRQLALAKLYRKYNNLPKFLEFSVAAGQRQSNSLAAQRQVIEARILNAEYAAAGNTLGQLQRSYPDNSWFLSRQVELLARIGNFQDALTISDVILSENPARRDIILLKARILWELKRWKDSIALYESVVHPPVEDILARETEGMILTSVEDQPTSSWWEVMTFSKEVPLSISDVIMSPLHVVDFSENSQAVNSMAAPYYALYRWQQRFNKELSVRRSVMRWEYHHAASMLEDVIKEYGSDEFLLYDLAGLYSRQDRLGDEALLYQQLEAQRTNFPGLADAVQRNNLKRRPQTFLTYTVEEDDGWAGYKAVKQEVMNVGGWYFPDTSRKWSLDIARINYESTNDEQGVRAWRSLLKYDAKIFQAVTLSLGGGIEDLGNGQGTTPLFYGLIKGEIADEIRAVLSVKQDVTPDTLASLTRNIKKRDYKFELVFNLFPRIVLGGYHDFIDYSDSNWTKNTNFRASYIFLPEPTLLEISYNYDFYDSRDGQNQAQAPAADGFALNDHPYWSPQAYWITRFSFNFKHQLSNDALARGIPSYYTIEYSLGYDSYDNDLHELKGSFNIEIAKKYILGASYGYVDMDVFQHHETYLTIMYRW
ncbi:tetratricopeptide repeat protein [Thermodesulfobacteriota bacterium]